MGVPAWSCSSGWLGARVRCRSRRASATGPQFRVWGLDPAGNPDRGGRAAGGAASEDGELWNGRNRCQAVGGDKQRRPPARSGPGVGVSQTRVHRRRPAAAHGNGAAGGTWVGHRWVGGAAGRAADRGRGPPRGGCRRRPPAAWPRPGPAGAGPRAQVPCGACVPTASRPA